MKRSIRLTILSVLALCLLTSCANYNKQSETEESLYLTVAVSSGKSSILKTVQEEFERENKGITLKFIELSSDFEQYSLLSAAFCSGEYLFDILEIEDTWVDDFVDNQWIIPLSDSLKPDNEYFDYVRDSFIRKDTTYASPVYMDVGMLYALNKYGWDGEYTSIPEYNKNTEEELEIDDNSEDVICTLMELIEYMDGDIDKALKLYNSIYRISGNNRMNIDAFKEGNVPIMHSWSSVFPELYETSSNVSAIFKAYNTPLSQTGRETSVAKPMGLSISSLTTHKDECEKILKFFSRDDIQKKLIKESGMYPLKPKLYSDDTVISAWNHIPGMETRMQNIQIRPHIKGYTNSALRVKNEVLAFNEGMSSAEKTIEEIKGFLRGE